MGTDACESHCFFSFLKFASILACKPIVNDDANIESLFQSFVQSGASTSSVNEIQLGDKFPKSNRQNGLDKKSEHPIPSKIYYGVRK